MTGEDTEELPEGLGIDDPEIMEFVALMDAEGNVLVPGSDAADGETVTAVRRSTTAARLRELFGDVDEVDAFTGMVSEPHVAGTEFGELQLAMWTRQFEALRDGDRFFYDNDPALDAIAEVYGVDFRRSLGDVITANTDAADVPDNVFLLDGVPAPAIRSSSHSRPVTTRRMTPRTTRETTNRRRHGRRGARRRRRAPSRSGRPRSRRPPTTPGTPGTTGMSGSPTTRTVPTRMGCVSASTILIAEDDQQVREALERILKFEGYGVVAVNDGAAALEAVDEHDPDAIVLDVMMPVVDGLSACRRLRAARRSPARPDVDGPRRGDRPCRRSRRRRR